MASMASSTLPSPSPAPDIKPDFSQLASGSTAPDRSQPTPESLQLAQVFSLAQGAERRKRKLLAAGFNISEAVDITHKSSRYALALALDQEDTLSPSPSAFTSFDDAVHRLLPYHIYQIHDEELAVPTSPDPSLVSRLVDIRTRFAKLRRRDADQPSDIPSLIALTQASTAEVRDEIAAVSAELRMARVALAPYEEAKRREEERIENERRVEEAKRAEERRVVEAREQAARAEEYRKEMEKKRVEEERRLEEKRLEEKREEEKARAEEAKLKGKAKVAPKPATPTPARPPAAKPTLATISVPIQLAQQLIASKIINIPHDPKAPKPPGTVLRTTEDKKGVVLSVDVAACTQQQLQVLARVLNINVKAPGAGGVGPAGGAGSVAGSAGSAPAK